MSLQPFVKWAGGKRQIIDKLIELMPKDYNTYFEPFVGGGAFLLELEPKRAVINDSNKDLISVYKCLRNKKQFEKMIELCRKHETNHSEEYYYQIRDLDRNLKKYTRQPMYFKAARCLYLNKACFNGLYRVSSKGFFNVPSSKREKVRCFNEDNISLLYDYFSDKRPIIHNKDFEKVVKTARKGDFVYFDPPYDIIGEQSFTSYTKANFDKNDQIRLRDIIVELTKKGVFVMASNANTPFIQDLYKDFNINIVEARRMINSKAEGRGKVEEVVILNY